MDIAAAINQYGFPIIATFGMGYFIYYIWTWVTEEVDPILSESHITLIGLIDRIRMLDNDLIRLNMKLDIVLQEREKARGINKNNDDCNTNTDSNNDVQRLEGE
tara:strand:+ start:1357 stop:1668 length:312 start_codon:yes stop_codon:yes gene_type:complete